MAVSALSVFSVTFLFVALLTYGEASVYFKPECSIPPPGTNYVAGPNTRSTLGILWDCLSIIVLCTWNIQHLNVPAIRPRAGGVLQRVWWIILDSRVKAKWMVFTILVPEILVGKALGERAAANASEGAVPTGWQMIHCYLANMGYFVLDWGDGADPKTALATETNTRSLKEVGASLEPITAMSEPARLPVDDTLATGSGEEKLAEFKPAEIKPPPMPDALSLRPHGQLNLQRLDPSYRYWALDSRQWGHINSWKLLI